MGIDKLGVDADVVWLDVFMTKPVESLTLMELSRASGVSRGPLPVSPRPPGTSPLSFAAAE